MNGPLNQTFENVWGEVEQRHHRAALTPLGVARDDLTRLRGIFRGPGKARPTRANLGFVG